MKFGFDRDLTIRGLSLAILAYQLYLPWSVKHLVTQDGPAHIYTAFVTQDLVLHRHTSPYHALYRVQTKALPNWTCTLLLSVYLNVFGPDHAEAFLMTLCLLAGYASFAFCVGWQRGPPLLIANWLIQSWFLWAGFYNFYLGMALLPFVLSLYLRRKTWALSIALILLFFTHLVPAALAVMTIGICAVWTRREWKIAAVLAPTIALIALYAVTFKRDTKYAPDILDALHRFPQKIFVYSSGWAGEQRYVWIAVLLIILLSMALMRRAEWKSVPGALSIATASSFLLYLLIPDVGFGGSVVKLRFAFAVFVLGALLICIVQRLHQWLPFIGIALTVPLIAQLTQIARQLPITSDAVEQYVTATDNLPVGAKFVRMYFPAPYHRVLFGMDHLDFLPLLHVDELAAVHRHAVNLSDYQSATGTFSVDFKNSVDEGRRYSLGFETPGADVWATLPWLNEGLPVAITHVVYYGDEGPAPDAPVRYIGGGAFVRIYKLNASSP